MGKFFYVARDRSGQKISGAEEASSKEEVINRLQAKNLIVINVTPEEFNKESVGQRGLKTHAKSKFRPKHYRITGYDLMIFCRQLATLLGAGVTILKSLDIINQQISSRRLSGVIIDLQKAMESGLSFHEAMAKHPAVFSELWINLVESGEASGNLAMVLNRLAGYLERNAAFKRKIISALIYPLILLLVGFTGLLLMTTKIIPTFVELFKGFDIKLPVLTQVLIIVSNFIKNYILFMFGAVAVFIFLLRKYIKTKDGRRRYENFLFNLPVFGEFFRVLVIERFASEMATLVESGVPILYSLEITEHSVGNLVLADIIRKIKEDVRYGRPLSQPLMESGFFEPMVVQMVSIGEEIGELSQMLKKLNAFYEEYVETFLERFTSMFEPLMIVFIAIVISLLVVGMFLPLFQIAQIGV